MAEAAEREESLGGRGLGWLTGAARCPGSATIADVLELNAEAIGIAQVEFRCAFWAPPASGPRILTHVFMGPGSPLVKP